jgi:hypothetical protein
LALFLRWVGFGPALIGIVVAFVVLVRIGQTALFGGKAPRSASTVVGMLFFFAFAVAHMLGARFWWLFRDDVFGTIIFLKFGSIICYLYPAAFLMADASGKCIDILFASIVCGVPGGYLAGGFVAGVFWIIERVWGQIPDPPDE